MLLLLLLLRLSPTEAAGMQERACREERRRACSEPAASGVWARARQRTMGPLRDCYAPLHCVTIVALSEGDLWMAGSSEFEECPACW